MGPCAISTTMGHHPMASTLSLKFRKGFFKDYARGKPCQIRIARLAGACCAHEDTTVLCHVGMPGMKAMGSRKAGAPDLCAAWGCHTCHDIVDRRVRVSLPKDKINEYHLEGMARTIEALVKAGVLPNP